MIKKLYILLTAVLISCVRGIKEGMVMHKPNVREHRWYKYYHRISMLMILAAGLFFIALCYHWKQLDFYTALGTVLISWELFELAYSYTRYGLLLPETENVFGLNYHIEGKGLIAVHCIRIIVGLTLITGGFK